MLRLISKRMPLILCPHSIHPVSYVVSQHLSHNFSCGLGKDMEQKGIQKDKLWSRSNSKNCATSNNWQALFTREFGHDLSHGGDLPATVVALKNPINQITYDESCMDRHPPGDPSKRAFTYFILTFGRFFLTAGLRLFMCKVILSMSASKDVLAMASIEMDVSTIEAGNTVTIKWRGKPVFVRNRTEDDIKLANSVNLSELRDPQTDASRTSNPTYLIVVGVCTHLGCVPLPGAGDYGGWFCPCHGSHYDISGRIRKGPAPRNLEVPEYKWLDDTKVVIG